MYRAFLDANVLFSAAYVGRSGLRRIWKLDDVALLTSSYAIEEARRNLDRADQVADLAKLVGAVSIIETTEAVPSVNREPHGLPEKDQPILWAAIDCGASHLVTGDVRHFGHLLDSVVQGVHVVRPSVFVKLCRSRKAFPGA